MHEPQGGVAPVVGGMMVTCCVAGLDIGWWWLNVVECGKKTNAKGGLGGLGCVFRVLGDWILIQVNGKFLVFFVNKIRCSGFQYFVGIRA